MAGVVAGIALVAFGLIHPVFRHPEGHVSALFCAPLALAAAAIVIGLAARIVEDSRARRMLPLWVLIPTPIHGNVAERAAPLRVLAEQAGFIVLDLSDVYAAEDLRSLWVVPWDYHPNARGHEIIAERLYRELHAHGGILPRSARTPTQSLSKRKRT